MTFSVVSVVLLGSIVVLAVYAYTHRKANVYCSQHKWRNYHGLLKYTCPNCYEEETYTWS